MNDLRAAVPDHSRFPALDGVRAVAVFAVLGTHAAFWTGRYERGSGTGLLARLDVGVALFFALSGFLLLRPWLSDSIRSRPRPATTVYLWRRAVRILPMYWLTVAAALLILPSNRSAGWSDWWHNLAMVQIYHVGWFRGGLTQTWSLCTEAVFYLLLPFLGSAAAAWTRRFGWRPVHLLAGCGLVVVANIVFVVLTHAGHLLSAYPTAFWLPSQLSWFAAGMALAIVHVDLSAHPERWSRLRELAQSPGVAWTLALALFLAIATPLGGPRSIVAPSTGSAVTKNLVYALISALVLIPAALGDHVVVRNLLANRAMQWLGRISYSMFLTHLIVLELVMKLLGYQVFSGSATQVFLVTTALTVAISAITYRYVEVPTTALRRLVTRPRGVEKDDRRAGRHTQSTPMR